MAGSVPCDTTTYSNIFVRISLGIKCPQGLCGPVSLTSAPLILVLSVFSLLPEIIYRCLVCICFYTLKHVYNVLSRYYSHCNI